ncbi:MAG: hypothetical protein MRJ92_01690 [Nitrospira sp.]|nr:hypothetical protein [Nitrospira sp.]
MRSREQGRRLSLTGQKIGIITYTNTRRATEIKQRLEFDPRVEVSTIHAFAWSLIAGYDTDIRQWIAARLFRISPNSRRLDSRAGRAARPPRTAPDRSSKLRHHAGLDAITRFVYSPTGDSGPVTPSAMPRSSL